MFFFGKLSGFAASFTVSAAFSSAAVSSAFVSAAASVAASVAAAVVSAGLLEHPAKDAAMIPANNNAAILFFILSLSFFFYLSFISKPGLCQRFHDPIKCLFYRGFRTGDVHPEESLSIRAKGLAAVKSKLHSLNKEFV